MVAALFYLFAVGAVLAAANVVLRREPVNAAIWLVACFFFLAGEYLLLGFSFIAAVQILVYVGAIMVLFLFVIMLLDLHGMQPLQGKARVAAGSAIAVVISALAATAALGSGEISRAAEALPADGAAADEALGIPAMVEALFTDYLLPFEVTSVLLVAAIVGALTLGRSQAPGEGAAEGGAS